MYYKTAKPSHYIMYYKTAKPSHYIMYHKTAKPSHYIIYYKTAKPSHYIMYYKTAKPSHYIMYYKPATIFDQQLLPQLHLLLMSKKLVMQSSLYLGEHCYIVFSLSLLEKSIEFKKRSVEMLCFVFVIAYYGLNSGCFVGCRIA